MAAEEVDVEAIEARAEAALSAVPSYLWDGERVPVPVDDIVDSWFNLSIREVEELSAAPGCPPLEPGQTISGLLLPAESAIWVSADEASDPVWGAQRRRFTICHELGHHFLHREGQQSLFCRHGSVVEDGTDDEAGRPPLPPIEAEANAFAAAVLMPAALVRRHYVDCDRDFEEMCHRFGCSQKAMGKRLRAVI